MGEKCVNNRILDEKRKREIIQSVVPGNFSFSGRHIGKYVGGRKDFMTAIEQDSYYAFPTFYKDAFELYVFKKSVFFLVNVNSCSYGLYHNFTTLMKHWELSGRFVLTEKHKPEKQFQLL